MQKLPFILLTSIACFATTLLAQQPMPDGKPALADPFVANPGSGLAGTATARSGVDPAAYIRTVFEVYVLDKKEALAVLESERGSAARYRRVRDLEKAGKARLEILTGLACKSGAKALNESVDELRYASKFDDPVGEGALAQPSAFDTRNVGDKFEMQAITGPTESGVPQEVSLNILPQQTGFLGFREAVGMSGNSPVVQPLFSVRKLYNSIEFPINEPNYLGTLTSATERSAAAVDKGSEISLAFVRVNVVAPSDEEEKLSIKPKMRSGFDCNYTFYSLERDAAREILLMRNGVDAAWKKVQTLLGEKKAHMEHFVSLRIRSGQKTTSEEIHEVRYATGFEPTRCPKISETTTEGAVTRATKEGEKDTANITSNKVTHARPASDVIPGYPSGFEIRNTGVSIELEPTLSDDGRIADLRHVVQSVAHLRDWKPKGLAGQYPPQPLFQTRKIENQQTVLVGLHHLVGTFNPPSANGIDESVDTGRTWLVFVCVTPSEP